jgi:hypothetical protein
MSRDRARQADAETHAGADVASIYEGPPARPERRTSAQRHRIDADPDSVERGLVSLVLTIVELLRQLMERQALRRVDQGTLTDDQIEKIGWTLMALEGRMAELREHFGLDPEDLNLDLGPLGPLLPYE